MTGETRHLASCPTVIISGQPRLQLFPTFSLQKQQQQEASGPSLWMNTALGDSRPQDNLPPQAAPGSSPVQDSEPEEVSGAKVSPFSLSDSFDGGGGVPLKQRRLYAG